jgi:transposase-like protein
MEKMATVEVKCPKCGETKVYKHGTNANGVQRYQCHNKECPQNTFMLDYINKGYEPGIDEQIIKMAANASGIRDTARVLGVSTQKVLDTLKKQRQH